MPDAAKSLTVRNALEPLAVPLVADDIIAAHCADCGETLSGLFCAACGQHRVEPPHTFMGLMGEWASSYFNLEGKLWVTLRVLVMRPGELSLEYFRGRRTRYFPPLKLYLTLSLIFFTVGQLQKSILGEKKDPRDLAKVEARSDLQEALNDEKDSLKELSEDDDELNASTRAVIAEIVKVQTAATETRLKALDENRKVSTEERAALHQKFLAARAAAEAAVNQLTGTTKVVAQAAFGPVAKQAEDTLDEADPHTESAAEQRKHVLTFIESLAAQSPKALFFFLPVFAAVYAFLFRKKSFYVESFVFTLNLHSFFLAIGTLDLFIPGAIATVVMTLGMAVYTGLAIQRVYGVSRSRAVTSTLFAAASYAGIFATLDALTRAITPAT